VITISLEGTKMKYQITYEANPKSEDTQVLNDGIILI